jgi:hypothetical protein
MCKRRHEWMGQCTRPVPGAHWARLVSRGRVFEIEQHGSPLKSELNAPRHLRAAHPPDNVKGQNLRWSTFQRARSPGKSAKSRSCVPNPFRIEAEYRAAFLQPP